MTDEQQLLNAFQLHQQGHLTEAEKQYRQILSKNNRHAKSTLLLGLLFYQTGRNESAVQHLERAVQLNPTDPAFHSSLAAIYRSLGWYDKSVAGYRKALALNPKDAGDHYDLGLTYARQECLDEAAQSMERAVALRPDQVLWRLELAGLCPSVMESVAAIEMWRAKFDEALSMHPPGSIRLEDWLPEIAQSNNYPPFNLPYHGLNDLPLKRKYAALFSVDAPSPPKPPRKPYRVGFFVTRSHERIFLNLMGGVLNHLRDPDLRYTVICPAPSAERIRAGLQTDRVEMMVVSEETESAIQAVRGAQFDLIYYWEAGSDALNYYLPFFRLAPVQCTSWGLSVTTGIPQMDYFISSRLLEAENAQTHYSEKLVLFETLPTHFQRPELPPTPKTRADFGLPQGGTLYFCPQNLLKFHPEFDGILAQILRRDPAGHVLVLEHKIPRITRQIKARFTTSLGESLDRVTFIPQQSPADFVNLMAIADVLLDTIHYSGGNTAHEALAVGTPLVTWPSEYLRGRLTLGRFNRIGVTGCVAKSAADYVDIAVKLGTDPARRAEIKAKILAANSILYEDKQAVAEFEAFFKQAIEGKIMDSKSKVQSSDTPVNPKTLNFEPVILNLTETRKQKSETVSLCMIVKNEAENLADCLKSVGDFADEIIVVDTGSTDRTVEIAESLGARVEHFAWIDDFAAARNESIRYATGGWIFWMDADDRLSPPDVNRLKQAVVSGEADVYACGVVGNTADNERIRTTAHHFRLFRNGLGLKFVYPLHEDLALRQAHRPVTIAYTNIHIEHTGYDIDPAQFKAKARRNLGIIEQYLAREPDNLRWQHHLGLTLLILGEHRRALTALQTVINGGGAGLNPIELYYAYLNLAVAYVKFNQLQQAEATFLAALEKYPQRQHLLIAAGVFYIDSDRPANALSCFERAEAIPTETMAVQGQIWQTGTLEEYLGLTHLLLAQPQPARRFYAQMEKVTGQPVRRSVLAQTIDSAWQAREWDKALLATGRLIGLGQPSADDWSKLATLLILKSGQTGSAGRICEFLSAKEPGYQPARILLTAIRQSDGRFWPFVTGLIDAILTDIGQVAALQTLTALAQVFRLSPAELIRQHGQWLISHKDYDHAAEAFALLLELAPEDVNGYKSLALALDRGGHSQEALVAWQMAEQLNAKK